MTSENKYYGSDTDTRPKRVKALFDRIASRYDIVNDVQSLGLHRLWKRHLIRLAHPLTDVKALDVCCGTGDVALALAERGADTIGIDFSANMLAQARRRNTGVARLQFLEGDAMQLPFESASFDRITIAYGLRNLPDFEGAMKEFHRVLRPDGRLIILDFGKPANRLWRNLYFAYLRWIVPLFGILFCGDAAAYSYILESLKHYPAQEGVARQMEALGLIDVRIKSFLGGMMALNSGVRPGVDAPNAPA